MRTNMKRLSACFERARECGLSGVAQCLAASQLHDGFLLIVKRTADGAGFSLRRPKRGAKR